jgi:hypothetical protein
LSRDDGIPHGRSHAELGGRRADDAGLVAHIDPADALLSVRGDGACDTSACHEVIALRQTQAIIPVRKNVCKHWKVNHPGARERNEILRATLRLGRAIWKRCSGYHCRSLIETKMICVKLMCERAMARDFDRQVAELQVGAAILNRFPWLGTPETVLVVKIRLGLGEVRAQLISSTKPLQT